MGIGDSNGEGHADHFVPAILIDVGHHRLGIISQVGVFGMGRAGIEILGLDRHRRGGLGRRGTQGNAKHPCHEPGYQPGKGFFHNTFLLILFTKI